EHGFIPSHRQVQQYIVAFARKESVRLNFEDDDRIASASGTVLTLPAKTQLGAGLEACRQLEVESLPTPQVDMLRSQSRGILEA
ncbi:hypothetical protein RSW32_25710, partial [Escherichia coli]|nr:hypothetical protein [Escherichia coli]